MSSFVPAKVWPSLWGGISFPAIRPYLRKRIEILTRPTLEAVEATLVIGRGQRRGGRLQTCLRAEMFGRAVRQCRLPVDRDFSLMSAAVADLCGLQKEFY